MSEKLYDLLVIGSGPAGTAALEAAHDAGARSLCLVESAPRLGGECPNWGCVPTKALLRSAEVLQTVRDAGQYGITVTGATFDLGRIMERKQRIVDGMTAGGRLEGYVTERLGAELVRGDARFVDRTHITVDGVKLAAKKFVVATGARSWAPPIEGIEDVGYWTSDELVTMKEIPGSVVIVGGGPIGIESAQILHAFGAAVTVVEFAPHILPREDTDIAKVVADSFAARGVRIMTGAAAESVTKEKEGFRVVVATDEGAKKTALVAEVLVVATGKRPAIDGLDLDAAGVKVDPRGRPVLDEHLRSSNPEVYFAGDAAGLMMFTNVAHEQGVIAAENAVKGDVRILDMRVVPRGTYCTPEVGSVGMTEREAREAGHEVAAGSFPLAHVGKASVSGQGEGMVKIIADAKTRMVLGGHVVGHNAAELVHEIALAMHARVPVDAVASMIHAYPTFAEAVGAAAYAVR